MKSTTDLLREIARNSTRVLREPETREIAARRGVDADTALAFVALETRLGSDERLPTAEELADLGKLARLLDAAPGVRDNARDVLAGKTVRTTVESFADDVAQFVRDSGREPSVTEGHDDGSRQIFVSIKK